MTTTPPTEDRHATTETRLRAALTARAALVTHRDLRREDPRGAAPGRSAPCAAPASPHWPRRPWWRPSASCTCSRAAPGPGPGQAGPLPGHQRPGTAHPARDDPVVRRDTQRRTALGLTGSAGTGGVRLSLKRVRTDSPGGFPSSTFSPSRGCLRTPRCGKAGVG